MSDTLLQSSVVLILLMFFVVLGDVLARSSRFYRKQVETAPGARFESLEGLRGILAVSVLLHHACATHEYLQTGNWRADVAPLHMMGGVPVTLFFMMTGFLYWFKAVRADGRIPVLQLYRSRALRIVPVYLFSAAMVLAIVLALTGWPAGKDRAASWGGIARLIGGAGSLPLHPINGMDPGDVNASVLWTLHFEWVFYLFVPFMARIARPAGLIALCILCAILRFTLHTKIGSSLLLCMSIFLFGMAAAQLLVSFGAPRWAKSRWATLATACLLLAAFAFPDPYALPVRCLLFAIFFILVSGGSLGGLLTTRGARVLGTLGLSIYLLHGIALFLARPLLLPLVHNGSPGVAYWLVIAAIGTIVIAVSALTYRWIEHPPVQFERRYRKSPRAEEQSSPVAEPATTLTHSVAPR